ncbi:DUF4249 domain-containing protein [Arundinibacter roseus]|uniref:DUF4249 domain-containing protein n=1 Tax=Arundinibacter roseus TaxID=2070510 RepID=A0A4R4K877_9BACT|nr:DUF4249 domain-containing protein [Arundinibacter roseus]TDB63790.1 DUF4249 domain-containing protein [Arundinibacter roseus]
MKISIKYLLFYLTLLSPFFLLTSCEDVVTLDTETGPEQLVVDGWITNQPGAQTIRLSRSAAYFNNAAALPALQASVELTDDAGNSYVFQDVQNNGIYQWTPESDSVALGKIGRTYTLRIRYEGEEYVSANEIKRVPTIDSLIYTEERFPIDPPEGPREGYIAEFFARDFTGIGDTYWIKSLKGGKLYANEPTSISIAYDASFSPGSPSDGLMFILPLRQSITINQLFSAGDTVGVELHSITNEAYYFLQQVRQESSNGGIFAVPPANIPTNIRNVNPNGKKALGYFGASAVNRAETIIDPARARPKE